MGFGFREKLRLRCEATTDGGEVIEVKAIHSIFDLSLSLSLSLVEVENGCNLFEGEL